MDMHHTDDMDAAVAFATKMDWLSSNPPPVHSVMLNHKGELAISRKKKARTPIRAKDQ
jgi:hypothetical protein